jgi:hypothetical protein
MTKRSETAEHIRDIIHELAAQAESTDLMVLAYLLRMVEVEAESVLETEGKSRS